jgi:hypothetical protein
MKDKSVLRYICGTAVGIAVANFVLFIVIAAYLGGDAFNGKQVDGYFCVGHHQQYTEVTRGVYYYSQAHIPILLLNYICALPAGYVLYRIKRSETR